MTERLRAKAQACATSVGLIDEKQLDTQLKGKSAAVRAFRYRVV